MIIRKIKIIIITAMAILNTFTLSTSQEKDSVSSSFIVTSVNGDTAQKLDTVFIKKGDKITLYPVKIYNRRYYSEVDRILFDGKIISPRKKAYNANWVNIAPILKEYDNVKNSAPFYTEPIKYTIRKKNRQTKITFDTDKYDFGTYYIGLDIIKKSTFEEQSALQNKYQGQIIQIAYREDNSYIGYIKELFNTPFILPPKRTPSGKHQTDLRIGSDCAELAIYGKRRQGYNIPYTGPYRIYQYIDEISTSKLYPDENGIYRDENENEVKINKNNGLDKGDIVHFSAQVSVFYEDRGYKGVFDKSDLLIQSYNTNPYITSIEHSSFFHRAIRLFKWKDRYNTAP